MIEEISLKKIAMRSLFQVHTELILKGSPLPIFVQFKSIFIIFFPTLAPSAAHPSYSRNSENPKRECISGAK